MSPRKLRYSKVIADDSSNTLDDEKASDDSISVRKSKVASDIIDSDSSEILLKKNKDAYKTKTPVKRKLLVSDRSERDTDEELVEKSHPSDSNDGGLLGTPKKKTKSVKITDDDDSDNAELTIKNKKADGKKGKQKKSEITDENETKSDDTEPKQKKKNTRNEKIKKAEREGNKQIRTSKNEADINDELEDDAELKQKNKKADGKENAKKNNKRNLKKSHEKKIKYSSNSSDSDSSDSDSSSSSNEQKNENLSAKNKFKKVTCKTCGTAFNTNLKFISHMHSVHSLRYKCEICSENFKKRPKLILHMKENHPEVKPNFCNYPDCGSSFHTAKKLRDHQEKIHFDCICPYCKKGYLKKKHMLEHVTEVHI